MKRTEEVFKPALVGKKIPILTLDNKWHKLFTRTDPDENIKALESKLNKLLMRQGKVNTETKELKKIKKKLMDEIVEMVDDLEQGQDADKEKKVQENKRLINECNEKLEGYQDEILDLPKEMEAVNYQLMLATMEVCYEQIKDNSNQIDEITDWLTKIRIELKKQVVRKQEREVNNHELYSYMHDIFGAEVINIFDMKYNPEEKHPKPASPKEE